MVGFKWKSHFDESRQKVSECLKGKNPEKQNTRKISESCSKGKVYC